MSKVKGQPTKATPEQIAAAREALAAKGVAPAAPATAEPAVPPAPDAPKPEPKAKSPATVKFVSRDPMSTFVMDLGDVRLNCEKRGDKRVVFNVPEKLVSRFQRHFHVVSGRITRA